MERQIAKIAGWNKATTFTDVQNDCTIRCQLVSILRKSPREMPKFWQRQSDCSRSVFNDEKLCTLTAYTSTADVKPRQKKRSNLRAPDDQNICCLSPVVTKRSTKWRIRVAYASFAMLARPEEAGSNDFVRKQWIVETAPSFRYGFLEYVQFNVRLDPKLKGHIAN